MASRQHARPMHAHREEVSAPAWELLLFVAGIFAALLVLSVVPVS